MIIKRSYKENMKHTNLSVAIGNFDGIHLGHRFILSELRKFKKAGNDKIAVISFYPHPVKVLRPDIWKNNLIRFRTKYRLLKSFGVDILFHIPFTKMFSKFSGSYFIEDILIRRIKAKNILVGEDFRFGNNREGDIDLLLKYAEKNMFKLKFFSKKGNKEDQFSSSLIRKLITMGNLKKANLYLNYFWEVEGKVISGRAKGRELGFPTANINYNYQICPANGIYAGWAKVEGDNIWRKAAISTGTRPHYRGTDKILEVHLLSFSGNLYQKRLRVAFIKKVRDEQKFKNEEELKNKMQEDCHSIKNILEKEHIINDNNGNNAGL